MTKLNKPFLYFTDMFLALIVAVALALMISIMVPHFIIGMALLAGMYGFFMLFQGFMIIPSEMPKWLEWVNLIAFHTYSWRSFMYIEFDGDETFEGFYPTGQDVLDFYEIGNVNFKNDMIVLAGYAGVIHLLSCVFLYLRYNMFRGKIEPLSSGVSIKGAAKNVPESVLEEPAGVKVLLRAASDSASSSAIEVAC